MKPFNLAKALAGEPTATRDGRKAIIFYRIPDTYRTEHDGKITFPIIGMILDADGTVDDACATWRDNGSFASDSSGKDIVGMWEEPKLTTEELMEKAFTEGIPVKHALLGKYHDGFIVVAKTRNGSYILQERGNVIKLHYLDTFSDAIQWRLME